MTEQMKSSRDQTPSETAGASSKPGQPDASVEAVKEAGGDQVQEMVDEANDRGYFGEMLDDTPREHYTLEGVGQGLPTPESDAEMRMAWEQNRRSF